MQVGVFVRVVLEGIIGSEVFVPDHRRSNHFVRRLWNRDFVDVGRRLFEVEFIDVPAGRRAIARLVTTSR